MITRTFIDKFTTIKKDSYDNFGLNAVASLNRGPLTTRFLFHFDMANIMDRINDGTYTDLDKLTHTVHMYSCGSVDKMNFFKPIPSTDKNGLKKRATGFEIILFKLPKYWDRGCGFDDSNEFWIVGDSCVSKNGCNWYNAKDGVKWDTPGIYTTEELYDEYNKYIHGIKSDVIIATQHFEYGNENLSIDITDYVNDIIRGNEANKGIGVAFSPEIEDLDTEITYYTGFFTDRTNTFYHPFLETRCDEAIDDDRLFFYLDKPNRLYFYANFGGEMKDLDELPVCKIDDIEYDVVHQSRGVYYANVKLSSREYDPETLMSDEWSNIIIDGEEQDDVYFEFFTLPKDDYFKFGKKAVEARKTSIAVGGINDAENLNRSEIREVYVAFRKPYTHHKDNIKPKAYYRIYIKDGDKEVDVVDWDVVNMCEDYNYFLINTSEYVPAKYSVDIKTVCNRETIIHKDELRFTIVSDFTDKCI
jgi:hypothetical protein